MHPPTQSTMTSNTGMIQMRASDVHVEPLERTQTWELGEPPETYPSAL